MKKPIVVTAAEAEANKPVDPRIAARFDRMAAELADLSPAALYRDAMRWRGLMACDSIRTYEHLPAPHSELPAHARGVNMQIWSHTGVTQNAIGRQTLIELADYMRGCLGTLE